MRRFLWGFFVSLGIMVLVGIVAAMRQPKPPFSGPLTLLDGAVVRLVEVTYGTNQPAGLDD